MTGRQPGQICQICGDDVGTTVEGDIFVACDVCGFPVCRPCYEYERKDGNQSCPQCKTKYKRIKGFKALSCVALDSCEKSCVLMTIGFVGY